MNDLQEGGGGGVTEPEAAGLEQGREIRHGHRPSGRAVPWSGPEQARLKDGTCPKLVESSGDSL